mgnify:CR=1 FL=1
MYRHFCGSSLYEVSKYSYDDKNRSWISSSCKILSSESEAAFGVRTRLRDDDEAGVISFSILNFEGRPREDGVLVVVVVISVDTICITHVIIVAVVILSVITMTVSYSP